MGSNSAECNLCVNFNICLHFEFFFEKSISKLESKLYIKSTVYYNGIELISIKIP